MGDLVVFFFLSVAVGTGLWTMERHHDYFSDFRLKDIFRFRKDAWLYIANQFSTVMCLIAFILRAFWLYDSGWIHIEQKWVVLWCGWHTGHAIGATIVHILTNIWLKDDRAERLKEQELKGRHA